MLCCRHEISMEHQSLVRQSMVCNSVQTQRNIPMEWTMVQDGNLAGVQCDKPFIVVSRAGLLDHGGGISYTGQHAQRDASNPNRYSRFPPRHPMESPKNCSWRDGPRIRLMGWLITTLHSTNCGEWSPTIATRYHRPVASVALSCMKFRTRRTLASSFRISKICKQRERSEGGDAQHR
jgi:hypothetical protein